MVCPVHHWHCVARAELTRAGAAGPSLCGCHHGLLALTGLVLWQFAAFWLSKGGREKGYAPGIEGNDVIGAGGHLGAGPGQGLTSTLMSTPWALPGCSWCSSGCCCGPSICYQALEAPTAAEGEACRGGKSHLEPTGLAGWWGEGVVRQGSSRGL